MGQNPRRITVFRRHQVRLRTVGHTRIDPAPLELNSSRVVPSPTNPAETVACLEAKLEDEAVLTALRWGPQRIIAAKSKRVGAAIAVAGVSLPLAGLFVVEFLMPYTNWANLFMFVATGLSILGIIVVALGVGWQAGSRAFRTCSRGLVTVGFSVAIWGLSLLALNISGMSEGAIDRPHSGAGLVLVLAIFIFVLAYSMHSLGQRVAQIERRQSLRRSSGLG